MKKERVINTHWRSSLLAWFAKNRFRVYIGSVLYLFCLFSCTYPVDAWEPHIHHTNGTQDSLFVYFGTTPYPQSTNTAFIVFHWLKPGETYTMESFNNSQIEYGGGWQIVALTDSTYNSYSEDYIREHDVYDKKWLISYNMLKALDYNIVIVKDNNELKILNYDE